MPNDNTNTHYNWFLIFLIILILIVSALHLSSINNEINGLGGDNAGYVLLAKSLSSLNGYRYFVPGAPLETHYPPVFPLLLAPAIWLFGINFAAMHTVVVLCELALLIFLFLFFKKTAGKWIALSSCLIFALNPFVNASLVRILSEFPYMLITAIVIFMQDIGERQPTKLTLHSLWLPLFISLAYLTRTAGLSILVSYVLYMIWRRNFRLLFAGLPILLGPRLIWMWWIRQAGTAENYANRLWLKNRYNPAEGNASLADLCDRIWTNIENIYSGINNFLIPTHYPQTIFLGGVLISLIILGIIVRKVEKKEGLMDFYVAVYVGLLLLWPVYEPRKLMLIMPFVYLYFFVGLTWFFSYIFQSLNKLLTKPLPQELKNLVCVIFSLICIGSQLPKTMEISKLRNTPLDYPPKTEKNNVFSIDWSHYIESYSWVKGGVLKANVVPWANYLYMSTIAQQFTPPNAVIIARKDSITSLYSHRYALKYSFTTDVETQKRHILDNNVDYILFDELFRDKYISLFPLIKQNPQAFSLVKRQGNTMLLKVLSDKL